VSLFVIRELEEINNITLHRKKANTKLKGSPALSESNLTHIVRSTSFLIKILFGDGFEDALGELSFQRAAANRVVATEAKIG
jgi:hypothetical protein